MKSSGTYNFHLVIIFFSILAVVNSRPPAAAPVPQPATEPAESPEAFIEQCCNATKLVNPKTCYQLLSPHAPNIHFGNITKGAIELIGVALNLAMDETSAVKVTIEKLIKDFPKLLLKAIIDSLTKCAQLLGSSIDRIEQSVGKLQHLNMTSKADLQFQIGTVLTLVVNAETFEAQCTDALFFNAVFSVLLQENNVTAPLNQSVTLTQTALALVAYTADHLI